MQKGERGKTVSASGLVFSCSVPLMLLIFATWLQSGVWCHEAAKTMHAISFHKPENLNQKPHKFSYLVDIFPLCVIRTPLFAARYSIHSFPRLPYLLCSQFDYGRWVWFRRSCILWRWRNKFYINENIFREIDFP